MQIPSLSQFFLVGCKFLKNATFSIAINSSKNILFSAQTFQEFFFILKMYQKMIAKFKSILNILFLESSIQSPFLDVLLTILSTKTHVSIGTFHFRPSWIPSWINLFFFSYYMPIYYCDKMLTSSRKIFFARLRSPPAHS